MSNETKRIIETDFLSDDMIHDQDETSGGLLPMTTMLVTNAQSFLRLHLHHPARWDWIVTVLMVRTWTKKWGTRGNISPLSQRPQATRMR